VVYDGVYTLDNSIKLRETEKKFRLVPMESRGKNLADPVNDSLVKRKKTEGLEKSEEGEALFNPRRTTRVMSRFFKLTLQKTFCRAGRKERAPLSCAMQILFLPAKKGFSPIGFLGACHKKGSKSSRAKKKAWKKGSDWTGPLNSAVRVRFEARKAVWGH